LKFFAAAQAAEVERIFKLHLHIGSATFTEVEAFLLDRRLEYRVDGDESIRCIVNGVKIPWTKFERVRRWPWEWAKYWIIDNGYEGDHRVHFRFKNDVLVEITVTGNG